MINRQSAFRGQAGAGMQDLRGDKANHKNPGKLRWEEGKRRFHRGEQGGQMEGVALDNFTDLGEEPKWCVTSQNSGWLDNGQGNWCLFSSEKYSSSRKWLTGS